MQLSDVQSFEPNGRNYIKDTSSGPKWFLDSFFYGNEDEIEVYCCQNTLIVTRGYSPQTRRVVSKFTFEETISSVALRGGTWVLDSSSLLSVQMGDGEWFYNNLPFATSEMWVLSEVVLLKRHSGSDSLPRLFSLFHPLDEVAPVLLEEHSQRLEYFCHDHLEILFSCPTLPFVFLYDCSTQVHVICLARYINQHDLSLISNISSQSQSILQQMVICPSATPSMRKTIKSFLQHSADVPPQRSTFLSSLPAPDPPKSVIPQICLERVWNEKTYPHNSRATKVFVCEDVSHNKYVCYIVSSELRMITFDLRHQFKFDYSEFSSIPCVDACPLRGLDAILILSRNGSLHLYSGPNKITDVHWSAVCPPLPGSPSEFAVQKLLGSHKLDVFAETNRGYQILGFRDIKQGEIVHLCLQSLLRLLPSPVAASLFGMWYGRPDKRLDEWSSFRYFLADLCGLDVERNPPKRHRTEGSDLLPVVSYREDCFLRHCLLDTLFALHCVYENMKVCRHHWNRIEDLGEILYHIAQKSSLIEYVHHYWRDDIRLEFDFASYHFPVLESIECTYFSPTPPSIYDWVNFAYSDSSPGKFLYLEAVGDCLGVVVQLVAVMTQLRLPCDMHEQLKSVDQCSWALQEEASGMRKEQKKEQKKLNLMERIVLAIGTLNLTPHQLECLPPFVAIPCTYAILWVLVVSANSQLVPLPFITRNFEIAPSSDPPAKTAPLMGDSRLTDAERMLSSEDHILLPAIEQDDDLVNYDALEVLLGEMKQRAFANSVGRGAMNFDDTKFYASETFEIPELVISGKIISTGKVINPDTSAFRDTMDWPEFHNGVAAGLRISRDSKVDSSWISYFRLKSGKIVPRNCGMLLALGLNGHLHKIDAVMKLNYLSTTNLHCTVAVLIGLAVGRMGSADMDVTRVLNVHCVGFLSPSRANMELPVEVQASALLGLGLVHFRQWNLPLLHTLLNDIAVVPPSGEIAEDLHAYSLCAGLAFGMVAFGEGSHSRSDQVPKMTETLLYLSSGGRKPALPSLRARSPINTDISSFGATVALGLLHFATSNSFVTQSLSLPPHSKSALSSLRPELITLRSLCRSLVDWSALHYSLRSLYSQLPPYMLPPCDSPLDSLTTDPLIWQTFLAHSAGWALAVGFKFVGTQDEAAVKPLLSLFHSINNLPLLYFSCLPVMENTILCLVVAAALIMAGSGHIPVLSVCRYLRSRFKQPGKFRIVNYGSHMAVSMAIGLLFFGRGRHKLACSPRGIVGMLCAFYPRFPSRCFSNLYHLQPMRHLYTLARADLVEPRKLSKYNRITQSYAQYIIAELKRPAGGSAQLTHFPPNLPHLNHHRLLSRFFSLPFFSQDAPTCLFIDRLNGNILPLLADYEARAGRLLEKEANNHSRHLVCYLLGPRLRSYGKIQPFLVWFGVPLRYEKTIGSEGPMSLPVMSLADIVEAIPHASMDFQRLLYKVISESHSNK